MTAKTTRKNVRDLGPLEPELLGIADRAQPAFEKAIAAGISRVRRSVSFDEVAATPRADIPDLWDWDDLARLSIEKADDDTAHLDELIIAAMVAAAAVEGGTLDVDDPFLRVRVEREIGNMIIGVRRASKEAIRRAVSRAATGQITQAELVQIVRSVVGLSPSGARAVFSYRSALLRLAEGRGTAAGVLRRFSLSDGALESLSPARVERLVSDYADRLIEHRAAGIARTETVRAVNAGRYELWRQEQADGRIGPSAKKVWHTALDERVCPVCGPMDGTVVALVDPFEGSNGVATIYPPIHPLCRCWLGLEA